MTPAPRLSIGVPVYNGGSLLSEMLKSLVTQTFTDFEIVISDNASTDDTSDIARGFADKDGRVRYYRNETNIGAGPNFNRVFELANSPVYFKWAAHDDLYKPTFLERCVEMLDRDAHVVLAYTMVDVIDETGENLLGKHPFYWRGCMDTYTDEQGRTGWMMGPLHLAEMPDPARRYSEFLNRMVGCFPVFGVIRAEALRHSNLHRSYSGSDRSLLAQLVLQGSFRQVHERLYINRYHRSIGRLVPAEQQRAWMDTASKSSGSPRLEQYLDLLRAPLTAGLTRPEAVRCFGSRHNTSRAVKRGESPGVCCMAGTPWIADTLRAPADTIEVTPASGGW
jgi:glycosyltransferase involved in cell wall biosynthesis